MSASDATVRAIAAVLQTHLPPLKINDIVRDLRKVEGNKSFCDTIEKLSKALENRNE